MYCTEQVPALRKALADISNVTDAAGRPAIHQLGIWWNPPLRDGPSEEFMLEVGRWLRHESIYGSTRGPAVAMKHDDVRDSMDNSMGEAMLLFCCDQTNDVYRLRNKFIAHCAHFVGELTNYRLIDNGSQVALICSPPGIRLCSRRHCFAASGTSSCNGRTSRTAQQQPDRFGMAAA